MSKIHVTCPSCNRQYKVEIEDGLNYESMECPDCGASIPIHPHNDAPAVPQAGQDHSFRSADRPGESRDEAVRLKCPSCDFIFIPPFDLKTHIGGTDCPKCGSGLPLPLKKNIVNPKTDPPATDTASGENNDGVDACSFFYACSVILFIFGQASAFIFDFSPVFTIDCGVSAIIFLLTAIYFKLPKPSK